MHKAKWLVCLLLNVVLHTEATEATFTQVIPVSLYGWLDQYSITDRHFVGDEACVPTSSTNGMTFLQNIDPSVFGTQLTGTDYASWMSTDEILIDLMNTTVNNGTDDDRFVWGLSLYMHLEKSFPQVQFSGIFPTNDWSNSYPQPSYVQTGIPSIAFISNALAAGSAVLVGINYNHGFTGGHELLFNGLAWDSSTNTGTAYFIDPLDPSQNYSPDVPEGPVKQTTGDLSLNEDGTIELRYNQYSGSLPYNGEYSEAPAFIDTVLSVGGSFYATYDSAYEGSKNVQAIINGFSKLDPTTASMFPVLAVLNTTASLEDAFSQFDPSLFNNLLFSEESVAHQLQTVLSNNLLQYQSPCDCTCTDFCQRIWIAPFESTLHQKGEHHTELCTYKNNISGGVIGVDFLPCQNLLTGGGFAYARTRVKWDDVHARSHINSYGGFVYAAWNCDSLWLDATFDYFYNKADGHRHLFITSTLPLVAPIDTTLHNKNHSSTYFAHLGGSYDLCSYACLDLWPFMNLDYTHISQSHIREHGGGAARFKSQREGN